MSEQSSWKEMEARLIALAWKDEAFRHELLSNPKHVLQREYGSQIPANMEVQVLEQTPDRY